MNIGAIIQARTSSSRLPKKVLLGLPYDSDITVLQQVIRRVKKSKLINEVIVATTTYKEDNEIVKIADKEGAKFYRGDKNNVLKRFYNCASENKIDIIVRITSDCPCIDWNIIDNLVFKLKKERLDYCSNTLKRSYPHGLDVEAFTFESLKKAFYEAKDESEKEHVTPYIYKSGKFKISNVLAPKELKAPDIRITLDTWEDYALLCQVYDYLYYKNSEFKGEDIVKLFKEKPWLKLINKNVIHKKKYESLNDEIKDAIKLLKLQEMFNAANLLEKLKR